jgi:hypothetical protein
MFGMFVIFSVLEAFIITVLFYFIKSFLNDRLNIWLESIILYLIAEVIFFCFVGEISFFGIAYKLGFSSASLYPDLRIFRYRIEAFYSLSVASSALLVLIGRRIRGNGVSKQ